MDEGAYWNYSLIADLILHKGVDAAWLLDTRLNKIGGAHARLVAHNLGLHGASLLCG